MTKTLVKLLTVAVLGLSGTAAIFSHTAEVTAAAYKKENFKLGSEFILDNSVKKYKTAEDAMSGNNPTGMNKPGKYTIYKTHESGAINITLNPGEPGHWINPLDRKPQPEKAKMVLVRGGTPYYNDASEAGLKTPSGEMSGGLFYIYKETENAVNVTKFPDKPGIWVQRSDGGITDYSGPGLPEEEMKPVFLKEDTDFFSTPEEVRPDGKPEGRLTKGIYFVREKKEGAISLSRSMESEAFWIVYKSTLSPLLNVDETAEDLFESGEEFSVYGTEADALEGKNEIKKYPAGMYFIVKSGKGAINVSTDRNTPGGWVKKKEN